MSKSRSFFLIVIPSATVFISSFCIMVLELVAARLIAKHLGSSLYTWTAVIGVVLAGITIGNYLGGRIADRFHARKALATLFAISSAACVVTVILNNLVGEWMWLWHFSWPARTFTHVSLVFLLPSLLLGTISPVVAKMALDRGLATGRTVGDIYAWGAAGSIAGTFAAGYYLIAAMGTVAIIWTIGGTLLLIAILYWIKFWPLYTWALVFIVALTMGIAPTDWAENAGGTLALRAKPNPRILYEDESQYCYIAVKRVSDNPDKRSFMQDKLMHSEIIVGDINNLQYFHTVIFAAITHALDGDKQRLSVMHIGGGGYVFPRYIAKNWPGSRNDVAEIDPDVTKAAIAAFGFDPTASLVKTFTMDARNFVDELLEEERSGGPVTRYDFIYEDAFSDYSVPYQLITKEFNDKIFKILTDDGVYMINSIGAYDSGRFVGAYVSTLEETFPYVYVVGDGGPRSGRRIFVLIAAKRQIDCERFIREYRKGLDFWCLNDSEMDTIRRRSGGVLLTDDYVPVENLLAPVVRLSALEFLSAKKREQAQELEREGKLDRAIAKYQEILEFNPRMSIMAYHGIAFIKAQQGRLEEAVENFRAALAYNEESDFKENTANIHYSLATALKRLGRLQEASAEFDAAVKEFHKQLAKTPHSVKTLINLGDLLAENQRFAEAASYFQKAVNLNPMILPNHFKAIQALEFAGQFDRAIQATQKAIGFFSQRNQRQAAAKLGQYLELLEFKKSKQQGPLN